MNDIDDEFQTNERVSKRISDDSPDYSAAFHRTYRRLVVSILLSDHRPRGLSCYVRDVAPVIDFGCWKYFVVGGT